MAFYYNPDTGRTLRGSRELGLQGPGWLTGDQAVAKGFLTKTPSGSYIKARRKPAQTTTSGTSSLSTGASASFEKAIAQYAPGGGFGKGVEAGLERGRVKSIASGTQAMVSAGLAGTSVPAGLGKKYEEEVAAPTRAGVESERSQRLSSLYATQGSMEQSAYESSENRSLQEYMQRYSGGGGGGGVSTPGLDAFGSPMSGSVQQQQLDMQRRELVLKEKEQKGFVSSLSNFTDNYQVGGGQQQTGTTIDYSKYRSPDLYQGESQQWREKQDFSKIGSII